MAVFFFYAAYVNLNDHDWYFWVPVYMISFVLAVGAVVKCNSNLLCDSGSETVWHSVAWMEILLCYVYIAFLVHSTNMFLFPQGEHLRELGGLVIILAWLHYSLNYGGSKRYVDSVSNSPVGLGTVVLSLATIPLLVWSPCFHHDWNQLAAYCGRIDPNS